jgi:hypothetical protein
MLDAARAKALAAIEATGLGLGLGSEGSFGPHLSVPFIPAGPEVLLCLERKRGLEIHEAGYRTHQLPMLRLQGERRHPEVPIFLTHVRFPSHAIVATSKASVAARKIAKGMTSGVDRVKNSTKIPDHG